MTEYLQMSSIILSQYLLSSHTQRQQKDTLIVSRNYDVRVYFISKVCNHFFFALNIPKNSIILIYKKRKTYRHRLIAASISRYGLYIGIPQLLLHMSTQVDFKEYTKSLDVI